MTIKNLLYTIYVILLMTSCGTSAPTSNALDVDHGIWDKLLKKHVNNQGMVDYKGFKQDRAELKKYLNLLSKSAPNNKWSKDEQLAYWINAYNAYTIELILEHYPVKSIKDIGSSIKIPFVNTPWDVKFIEIGGKKMDLNNIEHGIIRKQFNEPRIHFALVCAAKSCPPLRNEAFTADKLDKQLDDQGRDFLNDPTKNVVTKNSASITKIMDWYGGDFKKKMPVKEWINKYAKTKLESDAISYMNYNWALNEQ
ncbi:DUF547 domain-containing protein [Arundinibacter roseus]|uniref:DUF547 domain-containing protein n=1 Tax=Arundinibacter roseus TaxID=2070510 RepID=A0A4R4KBD0_9BACT|nr:DUF547 domain-containing protein [Arundinibacter roseus]TDB65058.1 DUF547 domain-containing protein [Arundinibacter roseus]